MPNVTHLGINQSLILCAKILYGRLAIAKGFYKNDDMPTFADRDGGLQRGLTSVENTITDGFE